MRERLEAGAIYRALQAHVLARDSQSGVPIILPSIVRVRHSDETGGVGGIGGIARRVTSSRYLHQCTVVQVVGRECLATELLWCFDDGSGQAHF